jgi:hypothetical protein
VQHPDREAVALYHLARNELSGLSEHRILKSVGRLLAEETVKGGVAGAPTFQPQRSPRPEAKIGEEVLRLPQGGTAGAERGRETAQQPEMVVEHPRAGAGVFDLPVPRDVSVPQGTPGLCFCDWHDLLPPGLPLFCAR